MATTEQEQLDTAQDRLSKVMAMTGKLELVASEKADEYCEAGNFDASADLREIEADLMDARSALTKAYAKARRLNLNGITARSGDK